MASVKIVQNTALLLLSWWSQKSLQFALCGPKDPIGHGLRFGTVSHIGEEPAYCSDPKKSLTGCLDLSSKEAFCASDPAAVIRVFNRIEML
jgi:hypothetical protein